MTERQKDVVASYFDALLHEDKVVAQKDEAPIQHVVAESKPAGNLTLPKTQFNTSTVGDKKETVRKKAPNKTAFPDVKQARSRPLAPPKLSRDVKDESDLSASERQKLEVLLKPKLKVQKDVLSSATESKPVVLEDKPVSGDLETLEVEREAHETVPSPAEIKPPPESDKKTTHSLSASSMVSPVSEVELEPSLHMEWAANGRPVWAEGRFDVLLFKVAGLTLAVPLVTLGHIHAINDDLTPLFGQADWFMGLQPSPNGQVRCVNTALFVMPERYDASFVDTAKYVISIDGMDWGLAVDTVQQPTSLNPDDVTWRTERSKRPWLAGTVKAAMCALIDVPKMGGILQGSDPNRSKA